jgi:hypothetical protein
MEAAIEWASLVRNMGDVAIDVRRLYDVLDLSPSSRASAWIRGSKTFRSAAARAWLS